MAINAHTFKLNLKDQQEGKENPSGNPNDLLGNLKQETKTTTDNIQKGGSVSDDLEDYSLSQNKMEEILLQGDLKVVSTQESCYNNENELTKFNILFVDFTKRMN